MMGNGFQGAMDPRMMMMQMQMQKQGPQGGTPMGPPQQMGGMGMRSPNAPQMPQAPQPQQPQNPMQGMNMQMLMEALKKRQGAPTQFPNTPGGRMAAQPGNQVDPMFGGVDPAGQAQAAGGAGGGLMGWLGSLGIKL
jgi:hypothetical protein